MHSNDGDENFKWVSQMIEGGFAYTRHVKYLDWIIDVLKTGLRGTNNLGDTIKKRRMDLGMEVSELATKIGLSVSAITAIENNKRKPRLTTVVRIATALKTNAAELINNS